MLSKELTFINIFHLHKCTIVRSFLILVKFKLKVHKTCLHQNMSHAKTYLTSHAISYKNENMNLLSDVAMLYSK